MSDVISFQEYRYRRYKRRPDLWVRDFLPSLVIAPWQMEMLRALQKEVDENDECSD